MSRGVAHRCGSDPTLLWLWCRPMAIAPIGPPAWEPPYAVGAALKRQKGNNAIICNMDGLSSRLSEVNQTKTSIIWYHLYKDSKKKDTSELIFKTEINSTDIENKLTVNNGKMRERDK